MSQHAQTAIQFRARALALLQTQNDKQNPRCRNRRARHMKGIVLAGGSFAGDQQAVAGLSQADVHPLTTLMLAGVLAFLAAFTSWSYFDARQHS